ncbi:MAG TPA: hypothetical protein VHJ34_15810 [Actinomycetota bacterium]|nr:hypothetical protein [Actinomycetota bacterium]
MTTRQDATARTMRCPACGGLNPSEAQWCGQCLERFDAPPPVAAPRPAVPPAPQAPEATAPPPPEATAPPPHAPARVGGVVRVSDAGMSWVCARCDAVNDFGAPRCGVCGSAFADSLREPETTPSRRDPNMAALLALLFPGAGHAYARHWPQALARAVLGLWTVLGTGVAVWQRGAPGSVVLLVWYGLAAFGLWVVGAHDAYRAASGRDDLSLLRGRAFLFVVLGLLAVLVMSVLSAVSAAPGG